jgi:hypothetical protein
MQSFVDYSAELELCNRCKGRSVTYRIGTHDRGSRLQIDGFAFLALQMDLTAQS